MMKHRRLALAFIVVAGCRSSSPEPFIVEEPVERPLPPASGTPVGLLLDESAKLELRADQIEKLHAIDQSLATRTAQIDAELRALERPPARGPGMGGPGGGMGDPEMDSGMGGPMGGGMAGGGMGGGGMGGGGMGGGGMGGPPMGGGGMGGAGMGGGGMGGPPMGGGGMGGGGMGGGGMGGRGPRGASAPRGHGPGGAPPGDRAEAGARQLLEERISNIRTAIARALEVLDPQQRATAMQILDDHGAADPSRLPPPPNAMSPPDGERRMPHREPPPGRAPASDGESSAEP